jgi:hypothetical protein
MCSLSAQRIACGASSASVDLSPSVLLSNYLEDALRAIGGHCEEFRDTESIQAVHLLCVTAMEAGYFTLYHQLMGLYHTIVGNQGLADEARWPSDLPPVEIEERRRLIWHIYRLKVHTSLILGHIIRCLELEIAVKYLNNHAARFGTGDQASDWLTGWNFVTDLYRGLEHILIHFRLKRRTIASSEEKTIFSTGLSDQGKAELLQLLKIKFDELPVCFRQAAEVSFSDGRRGIVYHTANIICTYQVSTIACLAPNFCKLTIYSS